MWDPSEDEAVDMFVRHFEALHKGDAATEAKQQAEFLKRSGDHEGHRIWMKVAERIQHLRKERKAA
jgi:ribosomal protein L18E